jgi:hypothetical protein
MYISTYNCWSNVYLKNKSLLLIFRTNISTYANLAFSTDVTVQQESLDVRESGVSKYTDWNENMAYETLDTAS